MSFSGSSDFGTNIGQRGAEQRTLTSDEITNKYLTLANTPVNADVVIVEVVKGSVAAKGIDYSVNGANISWDGLALESKLVAGDILIISY